MKNVWCAGWRSGFDPDEYIYHYTSFETALKIIFSDQFRLSPLCKMNDTTEQKTRLNYNFSTKGRKNDIEKFEKYWSNWSANSKLLCFSRDLSKEEQLKYKSDAFDVGGRGFALPRMWAQYAKNNSGICLIIRKSEFEDIVLSTFPHAICKNVTYWEGNAGCDISVSLFEELLNVVEHDPNSTYAETFLHSNHLFTDYSYFSKLKDWENEHEYRIFVPHIKNEYLYVGGVRSCLAGLVVGEQFDNSLLCAVSLAATQFDIPIRRIVFGLRRCSIESITEVTKHLYE